MKKYFVCLFLVFFFALTSAFAQNQPTTEQIKSDFAQWLPNMGADDSRISDREQAQQNWQKQCMDAGAPGKTELKAVVNQLMVEQLDKDVPVITKVWLLHQLAWTAGPTEVAPIAKLLNDPEAQISDEAARTLAKIPGTEAEKALKEAATKRTTDALEARIPIPGKLPNENVMPLAIPYASEAALDLWMKGFDQLSDLEKASAITGLAVRKAKKYYPLIFAALKSENDDLRRAAMLATERVGGEEQVAALFDCVFFDRNLARRVLSNLVGDGVDAYLLKEMKSSDNTDRVTLIAEILCSRYNTKAIPEIMAVAKKKDFGNRIAVFNAVARIADKSNLDDLFDVMLLITDRRDRDTAENAIARICASDASQIVAKMTDSNAWDVLPLLGRIGGTTALETIEKSMKSSNSGIHDAAVRALGNWPNATAAEKMLAVANDLNELPQNRIAVLRGYIRVMSLPRNEIGIPISDKEKVEKLKEILSKSNTRQEEKTLILERLAAVRVPESVQTVLEHIDDPTFQSTAAQTIVLLAHHNELRLANKELFTKALDKVIEVSKEKDFRERGGQRRPLVDVANWYKNNM